MARSNQKVVPEAKEALEKFKYEVASDMCVKNVFKLAVRTTWVTDNLCNGANATLYTYLKYLLATSFLFMLFFYLILSFHLIH